GGKLSALRTIFIAAACRDRARRLVCDCAFAVELGKLGLRTLAKALAPTSSISGAPPPKGGSFLNHRPSRSASGPQFPSRAAPICPQGRNSGHRWTFQKCLLADISAPRIRGTVFMECRAVDAGITPA